MDDASAGKVTYVLHNLTALTLDEPLAIEDAYLVVHDGQIIELGSGRLPSAGSRVNCERGFCIPGLIDSHMHFYGSSSPDPAIAWADDPVRSALTAAGHARQMLEMGITTVRDCASRIGVRLRDAITAGAVTGPQVLAANLGITRTGGHGDVNRLPLDWVQKHPFQAYLADGPDSVVRMVRRTVREGADLVKVWVTGGLLGADEPTEVHYHLDELRALVEEAHSMNRPVAAHCCNLRGVQLAIEARVDSIEHGQILDEETCLRMRDRNCWLVPTLTFVNRAASGRQIGLPPRTVARAREVVGQAMESVRLANRLGVEIAMGSDTYCETATPFGRNAEELIYLAEAGLTPAQALRSATVDAARLLSLEDRGRLASGLRADLLVLRHNPLEDLSTLMDPRQFSLVLKAGVPVPGYALP